jgi:hypothetical protein
MASSVVIAMTFVGVTACGAHRTVVLSHPDLATATPTNRCVEVVGADALAYARIKYGYRPDPAAARKLVADDLTQLPHAQMVALGRSIREFNRTWASQFVGDVDSQCVLAVKQYG